MFKYNLYECPSIDIIYKVAKEMTILKGCILISP